MNSTTTRTDAHSPKNLVTENYAYVDSFDGQSAWAITEYGLAIARKISASGNSASKCTHCGATSLRYFAVLEHTPTGEYIVCGETCLDNRFGRATADFQKLREQAQLDRQEQRIKKAVAQFAIDNADIAYLASGELPEEIAWNNYIVDISRKLRMYGELSTRQIEAARSVAARAAQQHSERQARQALEAVEIKAAVIVGRIEISGEVLGTKWHDSQFGATLKMTVRDARGFKVWGTVPSGITVERGSKVKFVATTVQSDKDESFGFFSRPSKAAVL